MNKAFDELYDDLISIGKTHDEICMLLGRFLEEEARDYVECMDLIEKQQKKKENIVIH